MMKFSSPLLKRASTTSAARDAALRGMGAVNNTSAAKAIHLDEAFTASNYAPVPVVFAKAKGAQVTDPKGKKYLDFLSAYGAVNQGHLHPAIVAAAKRQLNRVTLSSRAFHSDNFGTYAKLVTKFFGYDKMLPMNTGAEGVETALKLAKKWGYYVKKISPNQGQIVCCNGCFHGRTLAAISMSDDPDSFAGYEPLAPGFIHVPYGDQQALEQVFKKHHKTICGFIVEPIQGEAGVVIPPKGYLKAVRELCTKYNILFIADEVQSGLARTGKMLAVEHEGVRPDVVVLAKALGGGILPVSAVLADNRVMSVLKPGTHGSTFGGNPLANAVAIASLRVLQKEKLAERSATLGEELAAGLRGIKQRNSIITAVRARGLFAAIDVDEKILHGQGAYKLMKMLAKTGLLCKTTHGHTLRLSPPLVISRSDLQKGLKILEAAVSKLQRAAGNGRK